MKRVIPFFITLILISVMFLGGCGELDRDSELNEILKANEDALNDSFTEETCDYELFSDYMESWAKSSQVEIAFTGKHSTVLRNEATEGCRKEPSTVILCNFCTSNIKSCLEIVATASTCLIGPAEHGDIVLVITELKNGRFIGIDEVPDKYLKADSLINLQSSTSDTILEYGAKNATCNFNMKGSTQKPTYARAFEITMSIPKYTDPYSFIKGSNYPNPVNTIGTLLAGCKSSGKLFNIASFTCTSKEGYTPNSATAVIVVDSNSVDSIQSKFDKSYGNIEDKFEVLEDNFVYTMTETDMPDKVLSEETCNNLISLMYTLNTGICMQDEDTGIINASSYIKSIQTKGGNLSMTLDVRTRGESYLDGLSSEYETTAGLCSTKYKCEKHGYIWHSAEKSPLVKYFTAKVPLLEGDSNISLRLYENDMIAKRLPDQDMIIYTFEKSSRKKVIENVTHFMDPATEK